jgi:hypothetical protein
MSNLSMKVGNNGFCGADLLSALTSTTSSTIDPASPTHSAADRPTLPENSTPIKPMRIYDFSEFKCDKNDKKSMSYPNKEQYSKDDLDFLALAFAAVKISYLRGICYILIGRILAIYEHMCDSCNPDYIRRR